MAASTISGSDYKGRLFVSALGYNSEEAIDLGSRKSHHSVSVPRPQGVVYAAHPMSFLSQRRSKLYILQR